MSRKTVKVPLGPDGQPANAKVRRHLKEKLRREKLMRQKPPGFKERFIGGCFGLGIIVSIVFVIALTLTLVFRDH